jgi:hypothetical protein
MTAVVEYVLSGSRLKLHIPKEGVSIAFAPSGIKAPQRAQNASNGRPAIKVRAAGAAPSARPDLALQASCQPTADPPTADPPTHPPTDQLLPRPPPQGEKYADESLAFVRAIALQRDVEVRRALGLRALLGALLAPRQQRAALHTPTHPHTHTPPP